MNTHPTHELLSPHQLAERWGVTTVTLRRWRAAGRIAAIRIGPRKVRFAMSDVLAVEKAGRID